MVSSVQALDSWRVDETYVKIKGRWTYLYRAVDKEGKTVDFLLRAKRDVVAARAFFRRAFKSQGRLPRVIRPNARDETVSQCIDRHSNSECFASMAKRHPKFGTQFSLHSSQTTFSMLCHVDSEYLHHERIQTKQLNSILRVDVSDRAGHRSVPDFPPDAGDTVVLSVPTAHPRSGRPSIPVHSHKSWLTSARHLCTKNALLNQGVANDAPVQHVKPQGNN
jgi:hypothetical protein